MCNCQLTIWSWKRRHYNIIMCDYRIEAVEQGSAELVHEYIANTWHNLRAFPRRLLLTVSSGAEISTSKMPATRLIWVRCLLASLLTPSFLFFFLQFLPFNLSKSSILYGCFTLQMWNFRFFPPLFYWYVPKLNVCKISRNMSHFCLI